MDEVSKKELMKLSHKDNVRFALFCAYQVKEQWQDKPEYIKCMELVELWLENKASRQDCLDFIYANASFLSYVSSPLCATYTAANDPSAAYANAYSAAHCTNSYYYYHNSENEEKIRKDQREYYNELLYIDDIFEKLVLEGDKVV